MRRRFYTPRPLPFDPPAGADAPAVMAVAYADVGEVNPHNLQSDTPFVQALPVPLGRNIPSGTYGVRVGNAQIAAHAKTVMHRPDGRSRLLLLEGVWPGDLDSTQTLSLTPTPPDTSPRLTVQLSGGALTILNDGVSALTLSVEAATGTLSGSKPANLKGSNSDPDYIVKESFHEWHVTAGTTTDAGARFLDLTTEEDTPLLRTYLARGNGANEDGYEFELRLTCYKYAPWLTWEFTSYKHYDTAATSLALERLAIIPEEGWTGAQIGSDSGLPLAVESDPYGVITGITGSGDDASLNAALLSGPAPLSVAVRDLVASEFWGYGSGPSAIRCAASSLYIDLWSDHTGEALDLRGTGGAGEVQASANDYDSTTRGTARTWQGFLALEDNLPLAQRFGAWDDQWMPTLATLEASECFGPLKAAAGSDFSEWFRRLDALAAVQELAAKRHQHGGYAQLSLVPTRIPETVDASLDQYIAKEPMHSGRYGQQKDSYGGTGDLFSALLTGDRARFIRALQSSRIQADMNAVNAPIYLASYAGSSENGTHRRYRDPWTGHAYDPQYFYPEQQFTAYWVGGSRRQLARALAICDALEARGAQYYPHGAWGWACRYIYSHDASDLSTMQSLLASAVAGNYWGAPASLSGKAPSILWGNFRWGHNTCSMVEWLYEATGDSQHLDDLALAYRTLDFSIDSSTGNPKTGVSAYGQYTTPYHGLAYLKLRGYSDADVSSDAMTSMDFWIGDYIQAGTLRNHGMTLPAGDPDDYDWSDVLSYFNAITEEYPNFMRRFGPLIASWYA